MIPSCCIPLNFLKVLSTFRNVFFVYPLGEVDTIGIVISNWQTGTLKFCETKVK